MRYLDKEREVLERYLPGLDDNLQTTGFDALEKCDNAGIALFRAAGGPALLIPKAYGGSGATALEAAQIQRAIGSRSPSLGIAATMHNFSVATLVEYGEYSREFLTQIAGAQLLVASGFAEGRTGASILDPAMKATRTSGGYLVNGSKKPCSLSRSMHLLTASIAVPARHGDGTERAVAIIPADTPGIDRRRFWKSPVLGGAESDEIHLTDAFVPDEMVFFPLVQEQLDAVETAGFLWFELLVSASYLGMASRLVERAMTLQKGGACEQVLLVIETETAMGAIEGLARAMQDGDRSQQCLARALLIRFGVQDAITRAVARSAELLGGISFIQCPEIAYLLAATRALAFHPPSRISSAGPLASYFMGHDFQLV